MNRIDAKRVIQAALQEAGVRVLQRIDTVERDYVVVESAVRSAWAFEVSYGREAVTRIRAAPEHGPSLPARFPPNQPRNSQ